jgi:hypothetical protein
VGALGGAKLGGKGSLGTVGGAKLGGNMPGVPGGIVVVGLVLVAELGAAAVAVAGVAVTAEPPRLPVICNLPDKPPTKPDSLS